MSAGGDAGNNATTIDRPIAPASWPTLLVRLVQSRGVDVVWKVGLEILGYPPTWADSGSEITKLRRALDQTAETKE